MNRKNINIVLTAVLAVCIAVLGVIFIRLYSEVNYIPQQTIDDLCGVLGDDNISLDGDIVTRKKNNGTVYVIDSENYTQKVTQRLCGSDVKYDFVIPDGNVISAQTGEELTFGSSFYFSYKKNPQTSLIETYQSYDGDEASDIVSSQTAERLSGIITDFLDSENDESLNVTTIMRRIEYYDGAYFVTCERTISGVILEQNSVICAVVSGSVAEVSGNWCFLEFGDSYTTEMYDTVNILFGFKKDIDDIRTDEGEKVTIESLESCYTLYYIDGGSGLCLVPSVRIVTDTMGSFVYSSVDGTLYTKK